MTLTFMLSLKTNNNLFDLFAIRFIYLLSTNIKIVIFNLLLEHNKLKQLNKIYRFIW